MEPQFKGAAEAAPFSFAAAKMVTFIQKNYPDAFPRTRFSSVQEQPGQNRALPPSFAEVPQPQGGPRPVTKS
jgi:hypothetical protein